MSKYKRLIFKNECGGALVETAIALPILILIIAGIFEITLYALLNNKMVRANGVIGDMISRQNITRTNLIAIMDTVDTVMKPFDFPTQGRLSVSQVRNNGMTTDPSKMIISWQQTKNNATSKIGNVGQFPTNLPNTITVISNQTLIIVETFFQYTPLIFKGFFPGQQLYKVMVFVPRTGDMNSLLGE